MTPEQITGIIPPNRIKYKKYDSCAPDAPKKFINPITESGSNRQYKTQALEVLMKNLS